MDVLESSLDGCLCSGSSPDSASTQRVLLVTTTLGLRTLINKKYRLHEMF
jgi:hypothetical protein